MNSLKWYFGLMAGFSLAFGLFGCDKNPTGPLPPIQNQAPSFEEHMARLQTPGHTFFWIKNFTKYGSGKDWEYNRNWYNWENKGFPDQAYAVAYEMYHNFVNGENRGQCGQFACTFVVAARKHGYKCGTLLIYEPGVAHCQGWIVEQDGTVSITDNQDYLRQQYKTYDDFLQNIRTRIKRCQEQNLIEKSTANSIGLCNEKSEILLDTNGEYWNSPLPL